jgi:thiamine monophosphate synthase
VLFSWKALIGRSVRAGYQESDIDYQPGVDYVVFGTVFPSESHPKGPVAGLEGLAAACRDTRAWGMPFTYTALNASHLAGKFRYHSDQPLPVLAIGGITAENAGDCIRAGAAGVAVIRSVLMAKDPAQAAADILQAMREAKA